MGYPVPMYAQSYNTHFPSDSQGLMLQNESADLIE